mgnify:FL=1
MINSIFLNLKKIFPNDKFYVVGGTSRDYILGKEFNDYDLATNLTPDEIKEKISDADMTFAKYGVTTVTINNKKITLATMRKEKQYTDYRHPGKIEFVDDYLLDAERRDFTVNAIYLAPSGEILDPYGGLEDLRLGIIRMIGDPDKRLQEDPLRIIRAIRFSLNLGFVIDSDLMTAIKRNKHLINLLNPRKIEEEINKTNENKRSIIIEYLKKTNENML